MAVIAAMDVSKAIRSRHSVRAYLPDTIPKKKLEKILEAGRVAPSASNLQPWHFVVVTDPQKRNKLAEGGTYAKFLSGAPVAIVGCGDAEKSPKWHVVDTSIAMQNMVLAATAEGLGTCWIGSFNEEEVKKLLSIPENFRVVALLSVGYPREKLDLAARNSQLIQARKKLEEIASLEEFGSPFIQ